MTVIEGRNLAAGSGKQVIDTEVVVVGTGAGGGAYAAELAEAGVDVVMLEEGGYYRTEDFTSDATDMVKMLYRNAGAMMAMGKPNVFFAEGRCVGGSTTINAGISWRTPDRILKRWGWEHGVDGVTSGDMLPFFEKVEERVHVAPQDEITYGGDVWMLKKGADALGYRSMPVKRNHKHCVGTNNCIFGCPTGAKQSVLVTYIPRALAAGARLYSDCHVVRVKHDGKKATGVVANLQSAEGKRVAEIEVRAKEVVLCCGATQTPALLSKSRVPDPHKQIGKHLMLHPNCKVMGIFEEEIVGWKGAVQGLQISEYMEEGLLFATTFVPPTVIAMTMPYWGAEAAAMMEHFNHMASCGVLVEDTDSVGQVKAGFGGDAHLTYQLGANDFRRLQRGVAILCEMYFAAGATKALLPFHNFKQITSPDDIGKIFDPSFTASDIEVLTVHAMGTARMGSNPKQSVTDSWGKVHGLENLTVADASLFPTPIGVNPQITIMALATRIAQHWIDLR